MNFIFALALSLLAVVALAVPGTGLVDNAWSDKRDDPSIVIDIGDRKTQVGNLTGDDLYSAVLTSISQLCPDFTNTSTPEIDPAVNECYKRTVAIPNIEYKIPDTSIFRTGCLHVSVWAQGFATIKDPTLKFSAVLWTARSIAKTFADQSIKERNCVSAYKDCWRSGCMPKVSPEPEKVLCSVGNPVYFHYEKPAFPVKMRVTLEFVGRVGGADAANVGESTELELFQRESIEEAAEMDLEEIKEVLKGVFRALDGL
ncbi:hypothetical protein P280DRAFT_508909 [Massarina eburnea CBS 473.64]|uniref:Uncharacterized protein n=1 Tax=Massarina eburnea CBS 473.64 TaxID=1395130 RepID=A0A6A6RVD5_9PLEO|nr:hypothetical protein P280DRAFT_508909 [Massarina eburnea CBS 473.64]